MNADEVAEQLAKGLEPGRWEIYKVEYDWLAYAYGEDPDVYQEEWFDTFEEARKFVASEVDAYVAQERRRKALGRTVAARRQIDDRIFAAIDEARHDKVREEHPALFGDDSDQEDRQDPKYFQPGWREPEVVVGSVVETGEDTREAIQQALTRRSL
jgi:hypothetical protein